MIFFWVLGKLAGVVAGGRGWLLAAVEASSWKTWGQLDRVES
jgi:hypothetical protein